MSSNIGTNRLIQSLSRLHRRKRVLLQNHKRNCFVNRKLSNPFRLSTHNTAPLTRCQDIFPCTVSLSQDTYPFRLKYVRKYVSKNVDCTPTQTDDFVSNECESDLVVVLDMDECIIHSQFLTLAGDAENSYRQYEEGRPTSSTIEHQEEPECIIPTSCESFRLTLAEGDIVHVNKRPNLDNFLKEVTNRYKTYIFTAALEVYASPLLDTLDPDKNMFAGRFYRENCTYDSSLGVFVKDLNNIVRKGKSNIDADSPEPIFNEKKVVLVDNNPYSFLANPKNGILVSNFYDDPKDDTLQAVLNLLHELDTVEDVRPILDEKFGLREALKEVSNTQIWHQ